MVTNNFKNDLPLGSVVYIKPYSNILDFFPKVAKCTFRSYGPSGTPQKIDGLCVLPVNIFNEKIYAFMWTWFVILAVISSLGICYRGRYLYGVQ